MKIINTVYILGAGASMASDRIPKHPVYNQLRMPSGSMFFRDVFYQGATESHSERFLDSLGLTYEGTHKFLAHLFGLPEYYKDGSKKWNSLNIEDVFSVIDVAESSAPSRSEEQKILSNVRNSLIDYITMQIYVRCYGQHCSLLEKLFKTLQPQDSIISFNWDTLADVTLDILDIPQYYSYSKIMRGQKLKLSEGVYLKPHGSINWVSCPNNKCSNHKRIFVYNNENNSPGQRIHWYKDFPICSRCKSKYEIAIIPPTSRKLLDRGSRFYSIWREVSRRINSADRLVIIGYSLPKTDFHTEWIFREVNLYEDRKLEVILIDPMTQKNNSNFMKRYRAVFHKNSIKTTYSSFYEYVSKI